jgi:hypothetical protein
MERDLEAKEVNQLGPFLLSVRSRRCSWEGDNMIQWEMYRDMGPSTQKSPIESVIWLLYLPWIYNSEEC